MRMRFEIPEQPAATAGPPQRGAAPVGYLQELPAVELAAVLYLRVWCVGGETKDQIARDFRLLLGTDDAVLALTDFDALMKVTLNGARRPLMRHGLHCRCFGGDESAFANMIAAAAAQDRDDAMLFACTLLTGAAAFEAVRLAGVLGQVFLRIARTPTGTTVPTHTPEHHNTH